MSIPTCPKAIRAASGPRLLAPSRHRVTETVASGGDRQIWRFRL